MYNILVIHAFFSPLRSTQEDHLYCFEKYSNHRVFFANIRVEKTIPFIDKIKFDLIIFPTGFMAAKDDLEIFNLLKKRCLPLKKLDAVKIAFPQDEFIYTDALSDFINEFEIDIVFTVAPESEWKKIYSKVDFNKVKFLLALTGYINESKVQELNELAKTVTTRDIDIGYRAHLWNTSIPLGWQGYLKSLIAKVFTEKGPEKGFIVDIAVGKNDFLLGYDWFKFLLRCKYVIGVESGASLLDVDGSIRVSTSKYISEHPNPTFEEVEAACFPGMDGNLRLVALSPRNFECCMTRTCQILIEGEYNGVFKPNLHYIELKRDFSNLEEVFEIAKNEEKRKEIVERAYQDIVASKKYNYQSFVDFVIEESLGNKQPKESNNNTSKLNFYHKISKALEKFTWFKIDIKTEVTKYLPKSVFEALRNFDKR